MRKAGFIHVLDRCACHAVTNSQSKACKAVRAGTAHVGHARRAKPEAEKIRHQRNQATLGQQLVMLQIDDEGNNAGTILNGCIDAFGKGGTRRCAARDTAALMRPMLGDNQRLRLGKVENLAYDKPNRHLRSQRGSAFSATPRDDGR